MLAPIGLALDCAGALMLVLVEIPRTRVWAEPDDLSAILDALLEPPHELKEGDQGFDALIDLLSEKRLPISPSNWAEMTARFEKPTGNTGSETVRAYRAGSTADSAELVEMNVLRQWVEDEIDAQIGRRYRLFAGVLLTAGFALQILAYSL